MFFNLDGQQDSPAAKKQLKVDVDFKLIPADNKKSGLMLRVFNFENPELCPREGVVEFQPTIRSKRAENYLNFSFCYVADLDLYIGIPNGYDDKTGKIKWQRIILREDDVLDRTKPIEAMKCAVLLNSTYVKGSPYLGSRKAKYKVYDQEQEAEVYEQSRNRKRKAEMTADGLKGQELVNMGFDLGIQVDKMSHRVLFMEIGKYAERHPDEFLKIWENPLRKYLTILNHAIANGVVTEERGLGFMYNAVPLGPNKEMATIFLKENESLCQTIDQMSKRAEKDSVLAMQKIPSVKPVIEDEKDVLLAQKDQELEALKKQLAASTQANIETISKANAERMSKDDPEYASLMEEAKEYQIKSPWLCSKETLKAKIDEAKASRN